MSNYYRTPIRYRGICFVDGPKSRRELPFRSVMQFFLIGFFFKIFLFLNIGAVSYGTKIEALSDGNMAERAAARIMVLDPVSSWLIKEFRLGVLQ